MSRNRNRGNRNRGGQPGIEIPPRSQDRQTIERLRSGNEHADVVDTVLASLGNEQLSRDSAQNLIRTIESKIREELDRGTPPDELPIVVKEKMQKTRRAREEDVDSSQGGRLPADRIDIDEYRVVQQEHDTTKESAQNRHRIDKTKVSKPEGILLMGPDLDPELIRQYVRQDEHADILVEALQDLSLPLGHIPEDTVRLHVRDLERIVSERETAGATPAEIKQAVTRAEQGRVRSALDPNVSLRTMERGEVTTDRSSDAIRNQAVLEVQDVLDEEIIRAVEDIETDRLMKNLVQPEIRRRGGAIQMVRNDPTAFYDPEKLAGGGFDKAIEQALPDKAQMKEMLAHAEREALEMREVDRETGLPRKMSQNQIDEMVASAHRAPRVKKMLEQNREKTSTEKSKNEKTSTERKEAVAAVREYSQTGNRAVLPEAMRNMKDKDLFKVIHTIDRVESDKKEQQQPKTVTPEALLDGEARDQVRRTKKEFGPAADPIENLDKTVAQSEEEQWWQDRLQDWGTISATQPQQVLINNQPHHLYSSGEDGEYILSPVTETRELKKTKHRKQERVEPVYSWRETGEDWFTLDRHSLAKRLARNEITWVSTLSRRRDLDDSIALQQNKDNRSTHQNAGEWDDMFNAMAIGQEDVIDGLNNSYRLDDITQKDAGEVILQFTRRNSDGTEESIALGLEDFRTMVTADEKLAMGGSRIVHAIDQLRAFDPKVQEAFYKNWSQAKEAIPIQERAKAMGHRLMLLNQGLAKVDDQQSFGKQTKEVQKMLLHQGYPDAYFKELDGIENWSEWTESQDEALAEFITMCKEVAKNQEDRIHKLQSSKDPKQRQEYWQMKGRWLTLTDGHAMKVNRQLDDAEHLQYSLAGFKSADDTIAEIQRTFQAGNYSVWESTYKPFQLAWNYGRRERHRFGRAQARTLNHIENNMSGMSRATARFCVQNLPSLGVGAAAAWALMPVLAPILGAGVLYGAFKFIQTSSARGNKVAGMFDKAFGG